MGLVLAVPDHTQRSRRARPLQVAIPRRERQGPVHLVVDSTGLKVYGEGEWKVRQHGAGTRRTWRKGPLAVDGNEKEVLGVEVTTAEGGDTLVSRLFETQVTEVHARVAAMNVMTYPGMPISIRVRMTASWSQRGKGKCAHQFIYARTPIAD